LGEPGIAGFALHVHVRRLYFFLTQGQFRQFCLNRAKGSSAPLGSKKLAETVWELSGRQLAFPDNERPPPLRPQRSDRCLVSLSIAVKLLVPERPIAGWASAVQASVAVPEAAVHEDHSPIFREANVRAAWQVFSVQAEPEPHAVQQRADDQLRFGVEAADARHDMAALLTSDRVRHRC